MEKARKMKTNLCIPRLRSGSNGNSKNKTPAMTLLERFREAVLRLIMLSALSKATTTPTTTSHNNYHHHRHQAHVSRPYYNPADPHHSEAVADCIEFIKKKALADDEDYDHNNSASDTDDSISIDAANTTELIGHASSSYVSDESILSQNYMSHLGEKNKWPIGFVEKGVGLRFVK